MARILILDVETAYKVAAVWGRYKQFVSMDQLLQDSYVLCWSAKWLDDKKVMSDALHKHANAYKKDPTNDKPILKSIWKLIDEADYVIAHNGAGFDIPVLNARFIQQGMKPPSSYQLIDTLAVARRSFKFTSNRLGDLAKALKVGAKADTGGFKLWRDVVEKRSKKAFNKMVRYCQTDVVVLEKVYKALRAWDKRHPSTVVKSSLEKPACNACGSERVKRNGSYATNTQVYQKYKCLDCSHQMRARKAEPRTDNQKRNLLRSI